MVTHPKRERDLIPFVDDIATALGDQTGIVKEAAVTETRSSERNACHKKIMKKSSEIIIMIIIMIIIIIIMTIW